MEASELLLSYQSLRDGPGHVPIIAEQIIDQIKRPVDELGGTELCHFGGQRAAHLYHLVLIILALDLARLQFLWCEQPVPDVLGVEACHYLLEALR